MKKVTTALALAIALLMQVQAQDPNPKVISGVIAYDGGRYEEAIEKFNSALENVALVKEKNRPKLHYYLSQAYLRASENPELQAKYPNAALLAYEQHNTAKANDPANKFKTQLILAEQSIWPAIFNAGAAAYNEEKYEKSREHFQIAVQLNEEDPLSHMMLGYTLFMLEDTVNAMDAWKNATVAYKAVPPEEPNPNMASCYLLLSTILNMQGKTREALNVVTEGREMFVGNEDLQRTELSIYQQHPELFTEAESKFVTAIEENPDDFRLKLAYAALLQQANQNAKALGLYNEVLQKEPKNVPANLQVGAHFVNEAAKLNEEKMHLDDDDAIAAKEILIKEHLQKAYPYIKLLHEEDPTEPEWINQLVNIALYLDMEEEANGYIQKQQEVMHKGENN